MSETTDRLARDAWAAEQALTEARDPADIARAWAVARDAWAAWRRVARPNRHGPAMHVARGSAGEAVGHVATVDPADIPGWHVWHRPWAAGDEPGMIKGDGPLTERAC